MKNKLYYKFESIDSLLRPLIFFDLETTGLDPQMDRIVQFAFLKIYPDGNAQEYVSLVNPCIPIPVEVSEIHGITDDMVRERPGFESFALEIAKTIVGCDLAGFNIIKFDFPLLAAEMARNGYPIDAKEYYLIDAQIIFHKKEPRDLSAAYRFFCDIDFINAHDAMADVRATVDVFKAQLKRYPDLPKSVKDLHDYCAPDDSRWVTSDHKMYWRNGEAIIMVVASSGCTTTNGPTYIG